MKQVARVDSLEVARKAMPQQQNGSPAVLACDAQKMIEKQCRNAEPSSPVNYDYMTQEALTVEKRNVGALIVAKRRAIRKLRFVNTVGLLRTKSRRLRTDLSDLELRYERIIETLQLKQREITQGDKDYHYWNRAETIRLLISQVHDEDIKAHGDGSGARESQHVHHGDHGFSYGGYHFDGGAWDACDGDGE
jgi:hypothetical protein